MLILCLGSEYFHHAFAKLGHKVIAPPHEDGFPINEFFNHLSDRPDLVVYTDSLGKRAWPMGLEEIRIPKIYYAVDTPINFWWQRHFAGLFDICYVDQKTYVEKFSAQGLDARWLPVAVNTSAYNSDDMWQTPKIYDFGFVGVVDENVRGKRCRLIEQLSGRFSVKSMGGRQDKWMDPNESAALYRQSRLILNENLFAGVTTRMLEAMASGTVLFTEKAGGDLGELFMPGEDFAWFEPQDLFQSAEYWLSDEERLKKVAARALDKVRGSHDIVNRAQRVLDEAKGLNISEGKQGPEAWDLSGRVLFFTALRWPAQSGKERLLRAEKLLLAAAEESALSPEGKFILGHIARLKGELERATLWLNRAWDEGYQRAGLALGILAMGSRDTAEAARWLGSFTALGERFPTLTAGVLHNEAALAIADRLMDLGEGVIPGFNRQSHDPALWTAFEYYLSVHQATPACLEAGLKLSELLLNSGAPAEAMDVAGATLKHHPGDERLSHIYSQAACASYMSLN